MKEETENQDHLKAQAWDVARRLKEERKKARISQMDLSLKAGLSQNQVFCIETGRRIPNLYTLLQLCAALNINPASLFEQADEEKRRARDEIITLVQKYLSY
jgi:transcriptional regulator with XRE-family HTH domain